MPDTGKNDVQFRDEAQESLHEQSVLTSFAVVSPKAWSFLAVCLMGTLAALIWAFTYRVPDYVTANGICVVPESVQGITASANAQIAGFSVASGAKVKAGDLIATTNIEGIDSEILKAESILTATRQANNRFQSALDQWFASALEATADQETINATRLDELNQEVADAQNLLERQITQSLTANERLQSLYSAPITQSKKIVDSMQAAQSSNRNGAFSAQALAEQSRQLAQDESALLELRQKRIQIEEELLNGNTRISDLKNQKRELEQSNLQLSLGSMERKRTYESELMSRRLDEVRLSLELEALIERKQREGYIRSPHTGTILMLHKSIGETVSSGEPIGTVLADDDTPQNLQCLAYFSIGEGNRISVGDSALTTPSTHKRTRDGSIHGTVVRIEPYLANEDALFRIIGNRKMSQMLLEQENLIGVRIELDTIKKEQQDALPEYRWTGNTPQDFTTLKAGTTGDVRIRIDSSTPVELAFSRFRRSLEFASE